MLQDFQSSNFPCRSRERSQVSEHSQRRRCAGRICLGWVESEASNSRAADAVLWREVRKKMMNRTSMYRRHTSIVFRAGEQNLSLAIPGVLGATLGAARARKIAPVTGGLRFKSFR